jgi:putative ABC transport system permease protein
VAVVAAVMGVVVGSFFGWALVGALDSQGITELSLPVGQLIAHTVAAGIAGVLAGVPPGSQRGPSRRAEGGGQRVRPI